LPRDGASAVRKAPRHYRAGAGRWTAVSSDATERLPRPSLIGQAEAWARREPARARGVHKTRIAPGRPPHVVIVGAGFAGLTAAKRLGRAPVEVTVIDRRNHHLFQPLLYQVATAALSPADIAAPIRATLRPYRNVEVLLDEVTGIDTAARRVITKDTAAQSYDFLILATGSKYAYFGHEDWPRFAPGLKSVEDATDIRRRLLLAFERAESIRDPALRQRLLTFVLVGGGPTGVEMAGAIAELAKATLARDFRHIDPKSARILLVEAGPRLLPAFPEKLSAYARSTLARMGVDVRLETMIEHIDEEGVIARGERIPAATVIWSAGVQATPVGRWLGLAAARNGTVRVEPDLGQTDNRPLSDLSDDCTIALDTASQALMRQSTRA
jgi:NADH:ubiquinone reductase (H+-translocating)